MSKKRGASKTTRIVGLCSAANFINAADRVIMPITIVSMADTFDWNFQIQGCILSSFAFGYFTSQIIGACAAQKFGGKCVLLFAVTLWSLSTIITPVIATSATMLIICRIILGFGEGLGLPTIFHIFANDIPIEERSTAFGYLIAAGSIGQTIASVICPYLAWETSFYIFGILGVIWVFTWLLFYVDVYTYSMPAAAAAQAKDEIPLFTPKVPPPPPPPLTPLPAAYTHTVKWIQFLHHWPLWAIYIAHFSMNWANYIIMQWLPTYLSRNIGANKEDISFTAVPYVINSIVGVGAGHFADTLITRKWTVLSVRRLMTCLGLVGPGIFLLAFCAVDNLLAAVLFVSISMGLCACNSAGHLSNHADIAPNHAGVTFALSNTIATIPGILCGPLTAELVTASHGRWFPVFVLAAAVNFTGAIIYYSQSSASQIL